MPVQIPKHYKETSISKPNAIGEGIEGAAKTATSYITKIDNDGITVHPVSGDTSRVQINASGTTIYQNNVDVASYGATARIGKVNGDRVVVDSTNGITIYKGNTKRLQTSSDGIDIFDTNNKKRASVGSDGLTTYGPDGVTIVQQMMSDIPEDETDVYNYSTALKILDSNVVLSANPVEDGFAAGLFNGKYGWGSTADTRTHITSVGASRQWASDNLKLDEVYLHLNTLSDGTAPTATLLVRSGAGNETGIIIKASESSGEVEILGKKLTFDGINMRSANFLNTGTLGNDLIDHYGPKNLELYTAFCTEYSAARRPKVHVWGPLVCVYGAVKPVSAVASGGELRIGSLPIEYAPPAEMLYRCQGSQRDTYLLTIGTDGELRASRYADDTGAKAMGTSTFIGFAVTFMLAA